MKHIAQIVSEFTKLAIKDWDSASLEYQKKYLKEHPGTHRKLTGRPTSEIEKAKDHERQRSFHVVGTTVRIDLGHGHEAIIDRGDYGLIRDYKWSVKDSGGNVYAQAYVKGKVKLMHRMVAEAMAGRPLAENENVKWKNDNTLDNRRENLSIS